MGGHNLGDVGTVASAGALLLCKETDRFEEGRELRNTDGRPLSSVASGCRVEIPLKLSSVRGLLLREEWDRDNDG